jgi:hypothetical protein
VCLRQNGMCGMYDDDGSSGAVIRIISAGGVEAMDRLMNTYTTRPRVLEDTMVSSAMDLILLLRHCGVITSGPRSVPCPILHLPRMPLVFTWVASVPRTPWLSRRYSTAIRSCFRWPCEQWVTSRGVMRTSCVLWDLVSCGAFQKVCRRGVWWLLSC